MASTGEVGCIGDDSNEAVLTSMLSVGHRIPKKNILISSGGAKQKAALLDSAKLLTDKGYNLFATDGTYKFLTENGVESTLVSWPNEENDAPEALELMRDGKIDMVINIPKNLTKRELSNGYKIRRGAIDMNIPVITNARLANAFIQAFCTIDIDQIPIKSWNEYK